MLSIRGLRTSFGNTEVLHGVDLEIRRGEVLTLIGESGSGKSVLARSILGLAGKNARTTGVIEFNSTNLLNLTDAEMHKMRGADIGIIVQDAMAALNPMRTIGYQLCETIVYRHPDYRDNPHNKTTLMASEEVKKLAVDYLKRVGITAPSERMRSYAHQLSGGMRQRVMIALALIGAPKLLIADEPTTALDVVVQREILKELREIVKSESMSMLLVTHDLHLARDVADRVSVMYAGYILETGPVPRVLPNPAHPYTEGLLDAMPDMESEKGTLQPIKGEIPPPDKLGHGCPFAGRCPLTRVQCRMTLPAMQPVEEGWQSRCMRQPMAISGMVAKPNSSAPRRQATATSVPSISLPSASSTTRERKPFITRVCCVSARPSSSGSPACQMESRGAAPDPPLWPEMRILLAPPLATPVAMVPTPASDTSFTLMRALGLAHLRSKMSSARSSME